MRLALCHSFRRAVGPINIPPVGERRRFASVVLADSFGDAPELGPILEAIRAEQPRSVD